MNKKSFTMATPTQDKAELIMCTLEIKNAISGAKITKKIMPKDPVKALSIHGVSNPDSFLTIKWSKDGKDYEKTSKPTNMQYDETLLAAEEMTLQEFTSKWYKKTLSKEAIAKIQEEINSEVVIDDCENNYADYED
jgi:hypothetical protein